VICDLISVYTAPMRACVETEQGARIETSCLYPSFEPVAVYIVKYGDTFIVHDAGAAVHCALVHGRTSEEAEAALKFQANRYGLAAKDGTLSVSCASADWLQGGILAVANASAAAANAVVDMDLLEQEGADDDLRAEIGEILHKRFDKSRIIAKIRRTGRTGKTFVFDYAVMRNDRVVLIDAVTPHPASVVYKYAAFSQVRARSQGGAIAAYNRALKSDDSLLLQEVADVMPISALADSVERDLYVSA